MDRTRKDLPYRRRTGVGHQRTVRKEGLSISLDRLDAPSNGKNWHRGYQDAPKEVQCLFNTGEESMSVWVQGWERGKRKES
jgi:hypothetical protein